MRSTSIGLISVAAWMLSLSACERQEPAGEQARPEQTRPTEQPATPGQTAARPAEPGAAPAVGTGQGVTEPVGAKEEEKELSLDLDALDESKIDAEVKLIPTADGVNVVVEVDDAPPGAHHVVIHEKGDCSNAAGTSFGEPMMTSAKPAATGDMKPAGDLGTITADKDGEGKLERKLDGVKIDKGDPTSLMGRSIVIHEGDKAGRTSKDFGKPLACVRISRG